MLFNLSLSPCHEVQTADYEYEVFDESTCNCSITLHQYMPECGCDYPEPESPPLAEILTPGIIYGIVFLVGTVGNILVIFVVVHFKNMRNVTNMFLASLSTADLCLIWFCVPIQYIKFLMYSWNLGEFVCYALHYVQQFSMVCSVLTLTVLSCERYMAIAFPMKSAGLSSTGRVKRIIVTVWMLSAVLALPAVVKITYSSFTTARNITAAHCMREFDQETYSPAQIAYMNLIYSFTQFVLFLLVPVATMSFCYMRIGCIVYKAANETQLMDSAFNTTVRHEEEVAAPLLFRWTRAFKFWQRPSRNSTMLDVPEITNMPRGSIASRSRSKRSNCQATKPIQRQATRTAEQNKKQIVQMLVMIVVLYTVCWTPSIVDDLLTGFRLVCNTSNTPRLKFMRMTFAIMAYTQSCLNPIVYAFMSKHFRRSFADAWLTWTRRGKVRRELNEWRHSTTRSTNRYLVRNSTASRSTLVKKNTLPCSTMRRTTEIAKAKRVSIDMTMCRSPEPGRNDSIRRRSSNPPFVHDNHRAASEDTEISTSDHSNERRVLLVSQRRSIVSGNESPPTTSYTQKIGFI